MTPWCAQAFHKMLREISRKARVKKEWTPSQSVRYRRMVDNVRYMLVESKAFERAAEAMLRSTDSLSASAYRLATGDVRQALNTTLFHVKKVVKLADAITTEGRKHRFNLPALRRPPVKKLLKLRFAQSVYNAATAIQAAVNQPGDPGAKPKGRMDKPRVTGLLATWQRDWRQLLDTQTRSSGWEAVQRKVGKGNRTGLELELASQDSLAE